MNVKFYFIKYKLLFHLRVGDPIYCLPKKHNFQALHNFTWNDVKYLSFFSPLNRYNSITANSSFVVSSCCVRAVSDSDNSAAMQAHQVHLPKIVMDKSLTAVAPLAPAV